LKLNLSIFDLIQLLVVSDGQLEMAWVDASFFVVTGGIAGQLEHFRGQILQNGSQIDWGTGTNTFSVMA
jgi:hypothetical protein